MEEAIVDVALDLTLPLSEDAPRKEALQDMSSDQQDQARWLAMVPHVEQVPSPAWSQKQPTGCLPGGSQEPEDSWPHKRAARVETLRQCVANGRYYVDSSELALCLLRSSTRFVESR